MHPMLQSYFLSIAKIQIQLIRVGDFFFNSLNEDDISVLGDFGGPEWKKRPSNIIDDVSFDKVIRNSSKY